MKKILSILLILFMWWILYIGGYIHAGSKYIPPHFHANFAMYINGERIDFSDAKYSEDIAWCSITWEPKPEDRVHLHENNQDTIHIHDSWVSWGHFFANNNFSFWDEYIVLDSGEIYQNDETSSVNYVLNGKSVNNPFNRTIGSKDRLLIHYWDISEDELSALYETVSDNAGEYNAKYDPGSCGWTNENGLIVLLTEMLHSFHKMEH